MTTREIEALRPMLISMAIRGGLSQDDAEDAAQTAIIRVWSARGRIQGPARNFASRAMSRIVIDHYRDQARRPKVVTTDEGLDLLEEIVADAEAPELITPEMADALESLAPQLRHDLMTVFLVHGSITQAAANLGMQPGAIRSRVYRARKQLREQMAKSSHTHDFRGAHTSCRAGRSRSTSE